jgi:ankyrin repeat protein
MNKADIIILLNLLYLRDIRIVDKNGRSALHYAVKKSMYVAKYLIKHASPINILDIYGKSPLDYCSLSDALALNGTFILLFQINI